MICYLLSLVKIFLGGEWIGGTWTPVEADLVTAFLAVCLSSYLTE